MQLQWLDWLVVLIPMILVWSAALLTRRFVRGVSDFLAAGRCAGRYMVCNAEGAAAMGAITIVALFEQFYNGGPVLSWWNSIAMPVWLMVSLTGFIIYRYRQTRALTMAQFFEMRYSRKFRIFMGLVAVVAGIINFGIFPAVGARFIVYFCGFPETLVILGSQIPTFALIMVAILSTNLTLVLLGGQLTAMVSDCIEGIISSAFLLAAALAILWFVGLDNLSETISARPPGKSFVNPFDSFAATDFNVWFVLINLFVGVYGYMAWQGNQGFNASAMNPHEARMGKILGQWRGFAKAGTITTLALGAYVVMHSPAFSDIGESVRTVLGGIGAGEMIQKQMTVPVALGQALPLGFKGVFLAVILFAMMAADTSYMHSWGSIFIQDVVLPFRKKHLSPEEHIRLLRLAIAGVAIFAFFFSLLFRQTEYLLMYFSLTGAIYLGGAGSAIIGGLYWKRGTAAAAWAGMLTGSFLAVLAILIRQWDPNFFLNGQILAFLATLTAIAVYVLVSLVTCREPHNMDKLLNRGKYAEPGAEPVPPVSGINPGLMDRLIGIDSNFSRGDRLQSRILFVYSMFWFLTFLIITAWNLILPWPNSWWTQYTIAVYVLLPLFLSAITLVWFGIGGIRDLMKMLKILATAGRDATDDGRVKR